MGFAAGLRAGTQLADSIIEGGRQEELDRRAKIEWDQKQETYKRAKGLETASDKAWETVAAAATGVDAQAQARIGQTYGMTPKQIAAAGPDLKAKLASYDVPDASDLQNVPARPALEPGAVPNVGPVQQAGLVVGNAASPPPVQQASPPGASPPPSALPVPGAAPAGASPFATTAGDINIGKPDEAAIEHALGGVSIAKQDAEGYRKSREQGRAIEVRDAYNVVGKMSPEEKASRAAKLNTNVSSIGLLSLGPVGKGGYRFMQIDPTTGKEGKQFTLNDSQRDTLITASVLAEKGFGKEALEMASGVSKDVAEAIKAQNKNVGDVAQQNTTATHYANADANAAANTAIARDRLGMERERYNAEKGKAVAADDQGYMVEGKNGILKQVPWPEGTDDKVKAATIAKLKGKSDIQMSENMIRIGENFFAPDPKSPGDWVKVDGIGRDQLQEAIDKVKKDRAAAAGGKPGEPAKKEALPTKPAPVVAPPPPAPVLTQNDKVLQEAAARQAIYDAEQQRQRGLWLQRNSAAAAPVLGE